MRYLFCLFFMINSAIAKPDNIDQIIDSIYTKIGDDIANQIFADKKNLRDGLIRIDTSFDINLFNAQSLADLNYGMQKSLIRKSNAERTDVVNNVGDIGIMQIFKDATLKNIVISNVAIPIILGNTYKGMDKMIKGVLDVTQQKRKSNYIILTGDRPFFPEDFEEDQPQWVYNMLVTKNIAYKKHFNEIIAIVKEYLSSDENNPLIKKGIFYNKLIALIDDKISSIGMTLINDVKQTLDSEESALSIATYRGFLYNDAIKYLPTEHDMAGMLLSKYDILNSYIILSKTKYQTQDRATTIDTYVDLLNYINENNLDMANLVFVGINNQIYRQWLEFILMLKNNTKLPRFGYVPIDGEIDNTLLLVDEFARLFYNFNKIIK